MEDVTFGLAVTESEEHVLFFFWCGKRPNCHIIL